MEKMKKLVIGAMAFAMAMPMVTGSVFAAEETGETKVSYSNTNEVVDPENPDNPQWAVVIPSAITFTDDNKKVDATINLVSKNGGALPTEDVTITVSSLNGYKLKQDTEELPYVLQYAGKTMTDVETTVGAVKEGNTTINGEAIFNATATKTGDYTDTLTYTITK